jgi:hypothetical protein
MARRVVGGLLLLACLSLSACYASTEQATNVGSWSAVLNAKGRTDGSPAHFYFEYATSKSSLGTAQAHRTPTRQIPPNVPTLPFSEKVTDLDPATAYWFRVCGGDAQTSPDVCGAASSFTTQPGIAGLKVSVGYANSEEQYPRTDGFPADWGTHSGTTGSVTFLGDPYVSGFGILIWDSGGVRLDNSTDQAISLDKVTVAIGTKRYNANDELWPAAQLVVPAHGTLILASAGGKDFDTSDAGGLEVGCKGPPYPPTPQIEITRAGAKTTFYDTLRLIPNPTTKFTVLNFDCGDETHPWQRVDVVSP